MISYDVEAFARDGKVVIVTPVAAGIVVVQATVGLLHVDDKSRFTVSGLSLGHPDQGVVVTSAAPGQVVLYFWFAGFVLGGRDEDHLVGVLKVVDRCV